MQPAIMKIKGSLLKATYGILILTGIPFACIYSQEDSVKNLKNTIRFNISNPVLFDWQFIILGYERVITDHQTLSMSVGKAGFPTITFFDDSLGLKDQSNERGFHFSMDYRFYLQKENKYGAPRGIYVGPYYGYNKFSRDMTWSVVTSTSTDEVEMGFDIAANLVGLQLGYQFVFWNRLSLDLVLMGPGLWHFNMKSHFHTTMLPEDEEMLLEHLNELLKDKFPSTDFVIKGGDFQATRNTSTNVMGFRYMINVGFRF